MKHITSGVAEISLDNFLFILVIINHLIHTDDHCEVIFYFYDIFSLFGIF